MENKFKGTEQVKNQQDNSTKTELPEFVEAVFKYNAGLTEVWVTNDEQCFGKKFDAEIHQGNLGKALDTITRYHN